MARRQSRMLPLGTLAPAFSLPDTAGKRCSLADFAQHRALLVAFICNHCPYVKHIFDGLVQFAGDYVPRGVAVVAINPNDASAFPEDSLANMARIAAQKRFNFPYLYDEVQQVARDYGAVCTPDLFLFDSQRKLAYRGQFDGSRPGNQVPVTGSDLRAAAQAVLAGSPIASQLPSVGCSIKWLRGQEPDWA